jgi:hypothetical protein
MAIANNLKYLIVCAILGALRAEADEARDCIAIDNDAARLACYDRALGRNAHAPVAEPPSAEFGMTPALKQKQEPAANKTPDVITVHVMNVQKNADGTFNLIMDNAQTWRTLESVWSVDFAPADEIVIKRGLIGAYYLRKNNDNRGLRAKRIE